jgi:hypothetical protein
MNDEARSIMLLRRAAQGAIAGAAGTTALNAVTYVDMALRARPASEIPQQAVDTLASKAGHPVPGDDQAKQNRLAGLGPLTGIATGVGVGVLAGLSRAILHRLPAPVAGVAISVATMLLTDGPMVSTGLSDPKNWSTTDWLSDLVPHLAYGVVTYATLAAMRSTAEGHFCG